MHKPDDILTDRHGRRHTYLRISLTERCNLRCTYCMPEEGIPLSPAHRLMQTDEVIGLASLFVQEGVTKIRLTGGEPLVRRDFARILEGLSGMDVQLGITTNAILADRFMDDFRRAGIRTLNVSLDSLRRERFFQITRRDRFDRVLSNIQKLEQAGFFIKLNVVLIKGFNDDEIGDFVDLTRDRAITVRFIEFMPFDGNHWDRSRTVAFDEVMQRVRARYGAKQVEKLQDDAHDTSRQYKIRGFVGSFGIIGTVTNPFCDTCNRLRLTADGRLKNCLFSSAETDLLSPWRAGQDIRPLIRAAVQRKQAVRAGMTRSEEFDNPANHRTNRSMITIGG